MMQKKRDPEHSADLKLPRHIEPNSEDWEPLFLYRNEEIVSVGSPPSDSSLIGKKAIGLARVPKRWTLPYIIVSSQLYSEWRTTKVPRRAALLQEWIAAIQFVFKKFEKFSSGLIIVRSSGNDEGMSSRGGYYSKHGVAQNTDKLLSDCLEKLESDPKISDTQVALLIQVFAEPKAKGHLSNERRCYEERRDWLGQTEQQGPKLPYLFTINVRKWRRLETPASVCATNVLECSLEEALSTSLKVVASWFYLKSDKRYHLEWVWSGANVFIVQADEEGPNAGANPTISTLAAVNNDGLDGLTVIRPLNDMHAALYAKIRNVQIYRSLDLPTVPLYVLDDARIINGIANGRFPNALASDLKLLVRSPVVIRTDVVERDHTKRQLLKRSDELRSYKAVRTWLEETARVMTNDAQSQAKLAFIFHNFIPATSSAFVYAEPRKRFVQIEGLWGLPEGLYYNSHDQFMVDTLRPDVKNAAAMPLSSYTIQRRCNFKNFFVAPTTDGRWTRHIVSPPFDWRSSIPKDEWLKKMAIESRRIAEREGRPLSIMWFVGVIGAKKEARIMPWFHEPFDSNAILRRPVHLRKKNVWELSFEVETSNDLARLEVMAKAGGGHEVKRIRISPVEDSLLRDRDALQKIGNLAKALDATIVLEGAILSHAYYQLVSTGAVVEVLHPFIGFEERHAYNKLVRDKIPQRIESLGEAIVVGKLEPPALLMALRNKLIEEAYEVHDASDAESILEELADIQEVILGIQKCIGRTSGELEQRRSEKAKQRGGFDDGLVLLSTSKGISPTPAADGSRDGAGMGGQIEFEFPEFSSSMTAAVPIGQSMLREISGRVDRWADSRTGEDWHEAITSIQVPVAKEGWEAATRRIQVDSGEEIVVTVEAQRRESKLHVEIRARATLAEPDLFTIKSHKAAKTAK